MTTFPACARRCVSAWRAWCPRSAAPSSSASTPGFAVCSSQDVPKGSIVGRKVAGGLNITYLLIFLKILKRQQKIKEACTCF